MADVNFGLLNTQLPGQIAGVANNATQEGQANALRMMQLQHGMSQNRLADLNYGEQLRMIDEEKQIRNALAGVDLSTPQGMIDAVRNASKISPKAGFALQKQLQDAEKARAELAKIRAETEKMVFDRGIKSRGEFAQVLREASINPTDETVQAAFSKAIALGVPMQEVASDQARILAMPIEQRQQTLAAYGAAAKDMMDRIAPKVERFTTPGGGMDFMNMNPNRSDFGQRPQGVQPMAPQMTPYEREQTSQGRQRIGLEGQRIGLEGQRVGLEGRRVSILEAAEERAKDPTFQEKLSAARARGETLAKNDIAAKQALPKVIDEAEIAIKNIDGMIGEPDKIGKDGKVIKGKPHAGFESVVGATWAPGLRFVPGTDASDFMRRYEQVTGESFLQAYETLRGGGAITQVEGEKATAAKQRMSIAQSEKEFVTAAREFQDVIKKGVKRAREMASGRGMRSVSEMSDDELKRALGL